jgi:CHAD domain-containing protein
MKSTETIRNLEASSAQDQVRMIFNRMDRYIVRLAKSLEPANVHHFRTNSRRVEVLIDRLAPDSRHKRKTLKLLSKLRKRAGKVRDTDVHIEFLKSLKLHDRQNQRELMQEALKHEHARRSRKLAKAADADTLKDLRKRLRREQAEIKLDGIDPVRLAISSLPRPGDVPISEKVLHSCRIVAKHARYLAELGGKAPEAQFVIDELKRAQDAIGEWHDVSKLKVSAEKRFGGASESPLVSLLQNLSRARFRSAGNALTHALTSISQSSRARATVGRKTAASHVEPKTAAAA